MATYRFPILIWEDFEGYVTAALVEDAFDWIGVDGASVGRNVKEATGQLKDYVAWYYDKHPWQAAPDFLDPQLIHFRVSVRPEYRIGRQIFPADEALAFRVACVHGRQEGGLLVCALPTLGINFYYYEPKTLRELATTYVQETLKGKSPQALSRYYPPKTVTLDEIILHIARRTERRSQIPSLAALEQVAEPLGAPGVRRQFSAAGEREHEVADLVERLTKEKASIVLVGEGGIGKTTVLAAAVREAEARFEKEKAARDSEESPEVKHRFWQTSGARLIAGMQYLGQWEARVEQVIEQVSDISGALCAGSLLDLILTGGRDPGASVAAFFTPYLQRGELRLIGEATPAELEACRRLLPGFTALFQVLNVPPFNRQQATGVLRRAVESLERNHRVAASAGVGPLVYRLFNRFAPYQALPGRAMAFLHTLFERAALAHAAEVTEETVIAQFVRQTGLPELFLRDELPLAYEDVVMALQWQVIGQPEPCRTAASLVTMFKAGLNDPARPIGVLMFCGPTGVGKTELAKAISKFFFGHGDEHDRLLRLDMSEYAGPDAGAKLISDARGKPSELIKRVRQQPFVVVLFDEIEKADARVFDVLLGVFDEGRLTDEYGRTTNFRSAVLIMTSNLGADKMGSPGFDQASPRSYEAEAMAFFRPEFFNRIDAVVRFDPLSEDSILAITRKELAALCEREGLAASGTRVTWAEGLVKRIAAAGYDARYGARPLQRTIEKMLVAPLARLLVERPELKGRGVRIDLRDDEMVIDSASDVGSADPRSLLGNGGDSEFGNPD